MSIDLEVGGMAVCYLTTLASIWGGVIILGRVRRNLAWILMLGGITLFSLGTGLILVGRTPMPGVAMILTGMMLFGFGFCFHCLGLGPAAERARELEEINTSLMEELDRLRQGGH